MAIAQVVEEMHEVLSVRDDNEGRSGMPPRPNSA
jgi:hypothetical protein